MKYVFVAYLEVRYITIINGLHWFAAFVLCILQDKRCYWHRDCFMTESNKGAIVRLLVEKGVIVQHKGLEEKYWASVHDFKKTKICPKVSILKWSEVVFSLKQSGLHSPGYTLDTLKQHLGIILASLNTLTSKLVHRTKPRFRWCSLVANRLADNFPQDLGVWLFR